MAGDLIMQQVGSGVQTLPKVLVSPSPSQPLIPVTALYFHPLVNYADEMIQFKFLFYF